jgi:hypothetical protein
MLVAITNANSATNRRITNLATVVGWGRPLRAGPTPSSYSFPLTDGLAFLTV